MATRISYADVRTRLRTMNSAVDVPDAVLDGHAYITTGDSWLVKILGNSGKVYASLSTDEQNLAKAAEIAYVAMRVVLGAPLADSKKGPLEVKDITPQAREQMAAALKAEYTELLETLGVEMTVCYVGDFGIDLLNADASTIID